MRTFDQGSTVVDWVPGRTLFHVIDVVLCVC